MNLFELQERLKDFSQEQLVREMQAPTGSAPQFLVLSELQRRQRMMAEEQAQMQTPQTTVAEDAIAAAGMPQGGLADMARSMAPQTDMDMNTAVQPVERMQEGGSVDGRDSGFIRRLLESVGERARNSRMTDEEIRFLRDERPIPKRLIDALNPGQSAADARDSYEEGDYPGAVINAASAFPLGKIAGPAANVLAELYSRAGDRELEPVSEFPIGMADGGVVRMQPGGLAGISRDLDVYSPTMEGAALSRRMMEEEDSRRRRAELAAATFQYGTGRMPVATGEDQLFDPESSPLLPQEIEPEAGAPPAGTDLRGLGTVISEMISGEDPEATATRLLESGQIDEDQYNRYIFGSSGERNRIARESLGYEEPRTTADPETDTSDAVTLPEIVFDSESEAEGPGLSFGDQFGDVDPNLVRRGGTDELTFGDIEPTGAPIPFALPIGEDQDADADADVDAVVNGGGESAPAVDDAFEQDKWLALAQAGLSLMSSQQPTIGGAIGEAGLAGITALRQARGERDERVSAQQARADRLAAAASRADRDRETYPYRQVDDIISMADSYAKAAQAIVEANFDTPPAEGDPGYDSYISNLAMANVLRRRALALTGQE
jgi:hypothetical protein